MIMEYYCGVCDEINKHKSNKTILKNHIYHVKKFRKYHSNKNPNFFHIDKTFNEYIKNPNEKFDLYLVKSHFNLFFDTTNPHIKADFDHNFTNFNLKTYLL